MENFIEKYINGQLKGSDIDDLFKYLGMNREEYCRFVYNDDSIYAIVNEHRKTQRKKKLEKLNKI